MGSFVDQLTAYERWTKADRTPKDFERYQENEKLREIMDDYAADGDINLKLLRLDDWFDEYGRV